MTFILFLTMFSLCSPTTLLTEAGQWGVAAASHAGRSADTLPLFDSSRAFVLLERQVSFGPRVPGTEAHTRCLQFLVDHLGPLADSVSVQAFAFSHAVLGPQSLSNVIARFRPMEERRLLLSAHWDSRPWADEDPVLERRSDPVPGANDGASGVAVLLEFARVLQAFPPPIGVDIVLFDGEDLGSQGVTSSWCLGSRYFARHIPDSVSYLGAINLDMVGGSNLRILREENSQRNARALLDLVFSAAVELQLPEFVDEGGTEIYDDHVPLQEAQIEAIDLIDLDYSFGGQRYWHTTLDTPERCSRHSLGAVGTLLLHVVYRSSNEL
jgi:hypothetical protein